MILGLVFTYFLCNQSFAQAKETVRKVKYKQSQEVNFEEQDIDGVARTPTGAYLVQKRGVDFVPLFKVRDKIDNHIEESIDHLE